MARRDFLVVYALLAVSLVLLWLLRKHDLRLGRPLLLLYLGFFATNAVYQLVAGEPMIFQGDTLGVTVDMTLPFFILNFGMFALAVAWWWSTRDLKQGAGPQSLAPNKRNIVKACIIFVPIQLTLLIFGEPHALTDEIGVIGTVLQWVGFSRSGRNSARAISP